MNSKNNIVRLSKEIDEIFERETRKPSQNHYLACTPVGDIGITVTDSVVRHLSLCPVKSRLELGKYEILIRLLENWLKLPLDFAPVERHANSPVIFTAKDPAKPTVSVNVCLPDQVWQQVGEPVTMLDGTVFDISWSEHYAKITIDQLKLSAIDIDDIKVGSTVLIASSFNSTLSPRLSIPGLSGAVVGRLELPELTWARDNVFNHIEYTSTGFKDDRVGEVNLYCNVDAKICMEQQAAELQDFLTAKLSEDSWMLQLGGGKKAIGNLLPIANGLSLHISQIVDSH